MKKDIEIPIVKEVYVALAHEWNDEFLSKEWNAYLINGKAKQIDMVLIATKGYDADKTTSTMRHAFDSIPSKSFKKIEVIQEEVLALNNEFFVTFFADNKLFEKKYILEKNTVFETDLEEINILGKKGILAK